ncbi:GNAT family N-acetyltransferase [Lentilactobacillus raoultii]|uniref:GNAT family N-acetyltransferase n=1 Tax=Lentilactobacillus raoultii TaxID=1987503 RepID=A0ABW3PGV7_9LACO|nr:GNAT family N-acetyltransferase [Lentilactobacillus raoultii]
MNLSIYHVDKVWQLADVYWIRRQTRIHGNVAPRSVEFDEDIDKRYQYLLIENENDPVGTARLNFSNENYAKIERVSIVSKYQGKGLGQLLIRKAEEWIADKGYSKIIITSLDTAIGFYEKLGYVRTGKQAIHDGVKQIYTEKRL